MEKGMIYQICLRSFKDFTGNGIGDIPGIIEQPDYLQWLGIDAIWVTPFNTSPMKDLGYDISDYRLIDMVLGIMQDFGKLVEETHKRNLKLIMGLVPNHTFDRHSWFPESKSSRNNPKQLIHRENYMQYQPAS